MHEKGYEARLVQRAAGAMESVLHERVVIILREDAGALEGFIRAAREDALLHDVEFLRGHLGKVLGCKFDEHQVKFLREPRRLRAS